MGYRPRPDGATFKRFRIPWYKRVLMWFTMTRAERADAYERVHRINVLRRREAERLAAESRPPPPSAESRPPPPSGTGLAGPRNPVRPSLRQVQKVGKGGVGVQVSGDLNLSLTQLMRDEDASGQSNEVLLAMRGLKQCLTI